MSGKTGERSEISMTAAMTAAMAGAATETLSARERLDQYDWDAVGSELDAFGCAVFKNILHPGACESIAMLYPHDEHFRSHIRMARHGFGRGEYKYFRYPLPGIVAELRS